MKYPEKINILGIEYSVTYVDKPSEVDIHHRKSLWGQVDYWTRTIRVYNKGRPKEDIWGTIIHEVLHAIDEQLHLNLFEGDEGHDTLDILELALTDTFFRNGWMK